MFENSAKISVEKNLNKKAQSRNWLVLCNRTIAIGYRWLQGNSMILFKTKQNPEKALATSCAGLLYSSLHLILFYVGPYVNLKGE